MIVYAVVENWYIGWIKIKSGDMAGEAIPLEVQALPTAPFNTKRKI